MAQKHRRFRKHHHSYQGGRCGYCRCDMIPPKGDIQPDNAMTLEHILPQKYGGKDTLEHTIAACRLCNCERGHRPLALITLLNVLRVKPCNLWLLIVYWHVLTVICFYKLDDPHYVKRGPFNHTIPIPTVDERKRERRRRYRQRKAARRAAC